MKRRDFFRNGSLALVGSSLFQNPISGSSISGKELKKKARNIIFMVSDGMSTGTLNMANLLRQRKEGKQTNWLRLYDERKVVRALMDTASASSLVTDSAAASSSWGGGVRVPNGSLNVNADDSFNVPILQKFKATGKSVGCVTTVPIAHATPAGFCVNSKDRGAMDQIADKYLQLRFDVMLGGGKSNFSRNGRRDKQDRLASARKKNFSVVTHRSELLKFDSSNKNPLLGIFSEGSLPYSLDRVNDKTLSDSTPSLAEMTQKAIEKLSKNTKGFVLQVEGGMVDWAAHGNDVGGLLYDQIDFDDAIKAAIDFAEKDKETLVVITTDHGNANPGLFYGDDTDQNFDCIQQFRHTNKWILNGINGRFSVNQVIERVEFAQGIVLKKEEAAALLKHYQKSNDEGLYNPRNLPFKYLAELQESHTSVGWGSMNHSGDYVELAMYGPGSELLNPFVKNIELHNFMLRVAGVEVKK